MLAALAGALEFRPARRNSAAPKGYQLRKLPGSFVAGSAERFHRPRGKLASVDTRSMNGSGLAAVQRGGAAQCVWCVCGV